MGAEGDLATIREQVVAIRRELDKITTRLEGMTALEQSVRDFEKARASITWLWRALITAVVAAGVAWLSRKIA